MAKLRINLAGIIFIPARIKITPNRTFCLNHNEFVNSLEDIIEDSNFEEDNEAEDLAEESQEKNNNDITWDPALK